MTYNRVCSMPGVEETPTARGVGEDSVAIEGGGDRKSPVARERKLDIQTSTTDDKHVEKPALMGASPFLDDEQRHWDSDALERTTSDDSDPALIEGPDEKPRVERKDEKAKGKEKIKIKASRSVKNNALLGASYARCDAKFRGDMDAAREMLVDARQAKIDAGAETIPEEKKPSVSARKEIPADAHFHSHDFDDFGPKDFSYRVCVAEKSAFEMETIDGCMLEDLDEATMWRYIQYDLSEFNLKVNYPLIFPDWVKDDRSDAASAADLKHVDPLIYVFELKKSVYTQMNAIRFDPLTGSPEDKTQTHPEHTSLVKLEMSFEIAMQVISNIGVFLELDDPTIRNRIKSQIHNCAASVNLNRFDATSVYTGTLHYVWHWCQQQKYRTKFLSEQDFQESPNSRGTLSMDTELWKLKSNRKQDLIMTRESEDIVLNKILDEGGDMLASVWAAMLYVHHTLKAILSIALMFVILLQNASVIPRLGFQPLWHDASESLWMLGSKLIINPLLTILMCLLDPGWRKHLTLNLDEKSSRELWITMTLHPFLCIGTGFLVLRVLLRMRAMRNTRTYAGSIRVLTYSNAKLGLTSKLLSSSFTTILVLSNMYRYLNDRITSNVSWADSDISQHLILSWLPTTLLSRVILLSSCFGLSRIDCIDMLLSFYRLATRFIDFLISSTQRTNADLKTWLSTLRHAGCLARCALVSVTGLRTTWCFFLFTPTLAISITIASLKVTIVWVCSEVLHQLPLITQLLGLLSRSSFTETFVALLSVVLCLGIITWWFLIPLRSFLRLVGHPLSMLTRVTGRAWNSLNRRRSLWRTNIPPIPFSVHSRVGFCEAQPASGLS